MTIAERRAQLVRDQRNLTEVWRKLYGVGDSAELLGKIMRQELEAIWDVLGEHEIILNRIVGAMEKVAAAMVGYVPTK